MWRPGGSPDLQQCQQNKSRLWYHLSRWSFLVPLPPVLYQSWNPQSKPWKRPEDLEASATLVPVSVCGMEAGRSGTGGEGVFLWLPVRLLVSSTAKADGTWRKEQSSRIQRFLFPLGGEWIKGECG